MVDVDLIFYSLEITNKSGKLFKSQVEDISLNKNGDQELKFNIPLTDVPNLLEYLESDKHKITLKPKSENFSSTFIGCRAINYDLRDGSFTFSYTDFFMNEPSKNFFFQEKLKNYLKKTNEIS